MKITAEVLINDRLDAAFEKDVKPPKEEEADVFSFVAKTISTMKKEVMQAFGTDDFVIIRMWDENGNILFERAAEDQKKPGLVAVIDKNAELYVDKRSGIAYIKDYNKGLGYSCHPNISETGSVEGMKTRGYWGKEDRTVHSHGFIYDIDELSTEDGGAKVCEAFCMCDACRKKKAAQ